METILVPTDFSPAAKNAEQYALRFAKAIKANLKLCNAMKVPAEAPMAGQVIWPLIDFKMVKEETTKDLKALVETLTQEEKELNIKGAFHPKIDSYYQVGTVTDMVKELVDEKKLTMVVMGMSGAGELSRLFLGSTSRDMIEQAEVPVLLIPAQHLYRPISKMAIATDLSEKDINTIHSMAGLARAFCAELLIVHVTDEDFDYDLHKGKIQEFLREITCKINYHKIYYRQIKNVDVNSGLEWLSENGQIEILAMVHHKQNLIVRMFEHSYTRSLAKHIQIPLLVFPDNYQSFAF